MTWTDHVLRTSFRGCIDDQGNPKNQYFPEIMIERVWDIPNPDAQAEFANQNYVSAVSIDPQRFTDVAQVFDAIVEGIRRDLSGMLRNHLNPNCLVVYPFSNARALIYNIWISNDNLDPQEQPRIHVTEIEDPLPLLLAGVDGSFEILPESKEHMMILIGLCKPWFDKTQSPQQELFPI